MQAGMQIVNGTCVPIQSYVGGACGDAQICNGGSVCMGTSCQCPLGMTPIYDASLQQTICIPAISYVGESCGNGQICKGNSTCDMAGTKNCTCSIGYIPQLDSQLNKYVCIAGKSKIFMICKLKVFLGLKTFLS